MFGTKEATRNIERSVAWFHRAAQNKHKKAKLMLTILKSHQPVGKATCLTETIVTNFRKHPARGKIAEMVREMAPKYGLNPNFVLALIEVESGFNPNAKSPKNAQGLMQLIPATAERFGVDDVWDLKQNLQGGMSYLKWLMKHFNGNIEYVLAGYNAGEKAVDRYNGIPPYKETQNYVRTIMGKIGN